MKLFNHFLVTLKISGRRSYVMLKHATYEMSLQNVFPIPVKLSLTSGTSPPNPGKRSPASGNICPNPVELSLASEIVPPNPVKDSLTSGSVRLNPVKDSPTLENVYQDFIN